MYGEIVQKMHAVVAYAQQNWLGVLVVGTALSGIILALGFAVSRVLRSLPPFWFTNGKIEVTATREIDAPRFNPLEASEDHRRDSSFYPVRLVNPSGFEHVRRGEEDLEATTRRRKTET